MIYTLTLNPSLDYVVKVEEFVEGKLNLTKEEYKLAGGKGINVSQVLKNLGHNSKALGYIGGFTGKFIEDSLNEKQILTDFIHVEGDTRINIKMKNGKSETEVNGNSPEISEENQKKLFEKLKHLDENDTLVLAGSIPKTLAQNIYIEIIKNTKTGVKIVVDTRNEILKSIAELNPFLVKPNHHELEEIFGVTLNGIDEIIEYGKKLKDLGPENVVVSMAGDGAILINSSGVYVSNVPKGTVKNSVGAGDSLVAGFVAAIEDEKEVVEAFKQGIASGSATAFSEGLCTKEFMESLLEEIKIEEIK
jgi:1-phosphofructokinase